MTLIPHASFRWLERSEPLSGCDGISQLVKVLQQRHTDTMGREIWIDVPTVREEGR